MKKMSTKLDELAGRLLTNVVVDDTRELRDAIREHGTEIHEGGRGHGASLEACLSRAEAIVLEIAAERLGLERLHWHRRSADLYDPASGRTIDCKRQRHSYFEFYPEHLGHLHRNLDSIDLVLTGDYVHDIGRYLVSFKQLFLARSLFSKNTGCDMEYFDPNPNLTFPSVYPRGRGRQYVYDHRRAVPLGVCVRRNDVD